jgi:hypothetical protein
VAGAKSSEFNELRAIRGKEKDDEERSIDEVISLHKLRHVQIPGVNYFFFIWQQLGIITRKDLHDQLNWGLELYEYLRQEQIY